MCRNGRVEKKHLGGSTFPDRVLLWHCVTRAGPCAAPDNANGLFEEQHLLPRIGAAPIHIL